MALWHVPPDHQAQLVVKFNSSVTRRFYFYMLAQHVKSEALSEFGYRTLLLRPSVVTLIHMRADLEHGLVVRNNWLYPVNLWRPRSLVHPEVALHRVT